MSEIFTISRDNFYQITKMEELRRAFSERHYAIYGKFQKYVCIDGVYQWVDGDGSSSDSLQDNKPVIDGVERGQNLLQVVFFRKMQDFVLSRQTHRLDYGFENIVRPNAEQDLFFADPKAFFQYVGGSLYDSDEVYGFRRAVREENGMPVIERCQIVADPDATLERFTVTGLAEAGDIFGHWIIEDLLRVFSAITSTLIFFTTTDDGTRWGLHNCGVYITIPAWFKRKRDYVYVFDYYQMIDVYTCTNTLTDSEYQTHLENGTFPDGSYASQWRRYRTGHFEGIYLVYDEPESYFWVNYNYATKTFGWPEPYTSHVLHDMNYPPWSPELIIPPGVWVRHSVGHWEWQTTEKNSSGYPAVNARDTATDWEEYYQWCSYQANATSENGPVAIGVTLYLDTYDFVNGGFVSAGPLQKSANYDLGETITIMPAKAQSSTAPYFIANWSFSNSINADA